MMRSSVALGLLLGLGVQACLARSAIHPAAVRLNQQAAGWLQAGRLDEAAAALEVCLEYDACHADALHNLGLIAFLRGDPVAAERLARRALDCRPDLVQAHNALGVFVRGQGRLADAVAWFESALEIDPGYLDARRNLALTLDELGDRAAADAERRRLRVLERDGQGGAR